METKPIQTATPRVAVYGSSAVGPSDPGYALARELGRELALAGATVMTGGYGGIMEACSRGAREAGGHVIGVTVEMFEKRGPVNPYVSERRHTADLFERLRILVSEADGFVVVTGSIGTLTELFLTWTLLSTSARPAAPLVLLGAHWEAWLHAHRHPDLVLPHLFEHVQVASTAAEAARLALTPVGADRARS